MIRVALIGESPFDTNPMCEVLNNEYKGVACFNTLLKRVRGGQLDSIGKMTTILKAELKSRKVDIVVFMRDLDGFKSENQKVKRVENWYSKLSPLAPKHSLLVNIQEIEALILADLKAFNAEYGTKLNYKGNPENQNDPKEFLKIESQKGKKKYQEKDIEKILPKTDFNKIVGKCSSFKKFIVEMDGLLEVKNKKR